MSHTLNRDNRERREGRLIAVAVDKDKSSRQTLKWAVDNFITRGQTLRLVHVIQRQPLNLNAVGSDESNVGERQVDNQTMDFFLSLRCFCTRRHIQCEAIVLEDPDVAKALIEYVTQCGIETLLLGAVSKSGLSRLFKATDIPASILKWAPDFCNVYVISKGKVAAARSASRPVPIIRSAQNLMNNESPSVIENDGIFNDEVGALETDIISLSGASADSSFFSFYENLGSSLNPHNYNHNLVDPSRRSNAGGTQQLPSFNSAPKPSSDFSILHDDDFSFVSDSGTTSPHSESTLEDKNDETRRLKKELKQTMDMYHAACREALAAKHKVMELQELKRKEEKKIVERFVAEEASSSSVEEKEKARYKATIADAEEAKKFVELEVQKRMEAEIGKALREAEERKRVLYALGHSHLVVEYQSLFHILAVLFLFYFYFSI